MYSRMWFEGALSSATLLSAAALLCASVLAAADRPDPQTRVVEEIVAKVNGEIITRGELEKQRLIIEAGLKQTGLLGRAFDDAAAKRAADGLRDQIDQLLLIQKGKELSINVDGDVNRRIAEIQSQSKVVDTDQFHDWLRQQTGETFEDFRLLMKNQ